MQIVREQKYLCDLADCRNKSDFTLVLDRRGITSRIHICTKCLQTIKKSVGAALSDKKKD